MLNIKTWVWIFSKYLLLPLETPRILRDYQPGLDKLVMAISMDESEKLFLSLWGVHHRGEEDQMQFRVMIDQLNNFIEVRFQCSKLQIHKRNDQNIFWRAWTFKPLKGRKSRIVKYNTVRFGANIDENSCYILETSEVQIHHRFASYFLP